MRWFVRCLAAVIAVAFVSMTAAVLATPWWARTDPVWSNGFQRWGIVIGGVWVPL